MTALVLDIITTAAILFAVASGLLIILGVLKIVNFAHGGFLTIGRLFGARGDAAWLECMAGLSVGGCGRGPDGAVVERFVIRPLYTIGPSMQSWRPGVSASSSASSSRSLLAARFSLCRRPLQGLPVSLVALIPSTVSFSSSRRPLVAGGIANAL